MRHVTLQPVISEKAYQASEQGEYHFYVPTQASKLEIATAVAEQFGVKVESVRTANLQGKNRQRRIHRGRNTVSGTSAQRKKACVNLRGDDRINLFEEVS